MEPRVHKWDVQRWVVGQRESEKVIQKERVKALLNCSADEAWETYLTLTDSPFGNLSDSSKPSYLLMAMRKVLDRYFQRKHLAE